MKEKTEAGIKVRGTHPTFPVCEHTLDYGINHNQTQPTLTTHAACINRKRLIKPQKDSVEPAQIFHTDKYYGQRRR